MIIYPRVQHLGKWCGHSSETSSDDNLKLGGSGFADVVILPPCRWQEPAVGFHQYVECSALFQLEIPAQVFSPKIPNLPSNPSLFLDLTGSISHLDHDRKIRYTLHPVRKQSVINMIHLTQCTSTSGHGTRYIA